MSDEEEDFGEDEEEAPSPRTKTRKVTKTKLAVVPPPEAAPEAPKKRRGRPKGSSISEEQKKDMEYRREQRKIIDRYLDFLGSKAKKKRGRPRSPETIERQLDVLQGKLDAAKGSNRLQYLQKKRKLLVDLEEITAPDLSEDDGAEAQDQFIEVAAEYSKHSGIEYETWRDADVPADVLKAAGVERRMV